MKKKLLRLSAITAMALSLTTGVAAANSGSILDTGVDSHNEVRVSSRERNRRTNNNNIGVTNNNPQSAHTGDARVFHNNEGGSAESGAATNDAFVDGLVDIDNSGGAGGAEAATNGANTGSVEGTGVDSYNKVSVWSSSSNTVTNNNNVSVTNNNTQTATSGDAKVYDNNTGGGATSGAASNTSENWLTVEITN